METTIEWTATVGSDGTRYPGYTWNPWWGCVKVSEACKHCYAATFDKRLGGDHWGPTTRRKFQSADYWQQPHRWDAKARRLGVRLKVFCASMADVFERLPSGHPDEAQMAAERKGLWHLIQNTQNLHWLLLTKRPENVLEMTADCFSECFPENVWVGTTCEDQEAADKRIPYLLEVPAVVRFLSCEPLLGPINLRRWLWNDGIVDSYHQDRTCSFPTGHIGWVITGGESGHGARPTHPDWFRSLRDQCLSAGVAFHHKQNGNWEPFYERDQDDLDWRQVPAEKPGVCRLNAAGGEGFHGERVVYFRNVGKRAAGRTLDGVTHDEFPRSRCSWS